MIISKTPLRLSFVGGGSDIPGYYRKYGGAVISTAIDKHIYITVNKRFDDTVRVSYSRTEEVESAEQVEHRLARAILLKMGIRNGIEITSIADIPSRGSGLGSSSSFTVGLLHALHAFQGRYCRHPDLGAEASEVEINILGEPIGKQDQYAAAVGGMNLIRFNPDDTVDIEPIVAQTGVIRRLEQSMMLFYTGIVRSASDTLRRQASEMDADGRKVQAMHRMVRQVDSVRQEIVNGNPDAVGEILHESWMLKRSLSPGISNEFIDDIYEKARAAGALGGKLLGAGGGGFLAFYVPPERHPAVKFALADLKEVPFCFEREGTSIVFYR